MAVYSLRDLRVDNLSDPGTLALSYNTFDQGFYPKGDGNGNFVSNPKVKGEVITGAYGVTIFDDEFIGALSLGVGAKMYKEEILNVQYDWHAYDAGVLWNVAGSPLSLGASIQNTNKDIHNPDRENELPQTRRAGLSYCLLSKELNVSADFIKADNADARYAAGLECNMVGPLVLRAGYKFNGVDKNNFTGGVGICLKQVDLYFIYARDICIDYAYTSFADPGDVQYVTVTLKLGAD